MNHGDIKTIIHPIYLCYTISIEKFYDEYWLTVTLSDSNSCIVVESNTYKASWWDRQDDPENQVFEYWIKYITDGNLW